jgi:hypothetical protein
MSVRRPRTRQLAFVNGNREELARSYLLSTRMECSANKIAIERSEPAWFQRERGSRRIQIERDAQFH